MSANPRLLELLGFKFPHLPPPPHRNPDPPEEEDPSSQAQPPLPNFPAPAAGLNSGTAPEGINEPLQPVDLLAQMTATLGSRGLEFQPPIDPNLDSARFGPITDIEELPLPYQEEEVTHQGLICCFCDDPLPDHPSARFINMTQYLQAVPEVQLRVGSNNPAALYLPFPRIATHCQLHRAEADLIPLAISRGWPLTINFESLPSRVESLHMYLQQIISGEIKSPFLELALKAWEALGSRRVQSVYTNTLRFTLSSLDRFHHIMSTLRRLFDPLAAPLRLPLSNEYLLRKVLVPEVAKCLIAQDVGLEVTNPQVQHHLEESRQFGFIFFPDEDEQT
ncbi:hypothetical protein PSTG_03910 [Puccinia striiformis f. sp. tritici PST-78]|uniref:Restriction of telomere capping protein 4 n=1 Tax=Puccinia striiformis f. sp. tritici PST-78 TaxID=1165861 RepID=A0A0L0VUM5_9BASI|nr:hypothetical protein PSTG_03910 [Puccinia striiformis f. sp. tritici PST-78]